MKELRVRLGPWLGKVFRFPNVGVLGVLLFWPALVISLGNLEWSKVTRASIFSCVMAVVSLLVFWTSTTRFSYRAIIVSCLSIAIITGSVVLGFLITGPTAVVWAWTLSVAYIVVLAEWVYLLGCRLLNIT